MDTDLLAFVTGLDPEEAHEVACELDPELSSKRKGKKKEGEKKKVQKVSFIDPAAVSADTGDAAGLADFTSVLASETAFAGLKSKLGAIASNAELAKLGLEKPRHQVKVVETPLPKVQQERIERQVASAQTNKEISKWQHVIQKNRQAESLSFPLNAAPSFNVTSGSLVSSFQPKSQFDLEMQAELEAAGIASADNICRLEEMEMNKLSAAEIEARYTELAKKRSLLFFQERKTKHQSKIKSKKYRRIKAKEKAKELVKREDQLSMSERREKAEIARAKERLTLKTRRANKWAQEMIHRRGLESGSRQEVVEQLRDKERLRQEIFGKARDTREGSEDEAELYLSGSEDEGNEKLNEDYFKDSEDESFEVSGDESLSDAECEGSYSEESNEEGDDSVVGRRTFGEVKQTPEMVGGDDDEYALPKAKKQKKASVKNESTRSSLFAAVQDEKLKTQKDIIKRAFANDDLFAEFEAEKGAIAAADAPKVEDLTLPGWGSWSGEGVAQAEPRVRIIKRHAGGIEAGKRKDANLKHVIINEKQNKKVQAGWMLPKLPYPYKSRDEYERATRQKPLGPEWSSVNAHRKRIQPRVQIKVGSIIDPIKFIKQSKE